MSLGERCGDFMSIFLFLHSCKLRLLLLIFVARLSDSCYPRSLPPAARCWLGTQVPSPTTQTDPQTGAGLSLAGVGWLVVCLGEGRARGEPRTALALRAARRVRSVLLSGAAGGPPRPALSNGRRAAMTSRGGSGARPEVERAGQGRAAGRHERGWPRVPQPQRVGPAARR